MNKPGQARLTLLLGLTLLSARASAAPATAVAAVNANDVTALGTLSKTAPTAPQRALAAGALLALRHEDAEATAMLKPVTRSTAPRVVRATAFKVLSDVYLRNQRYRTAQSSILEAESLLGHSTRSDIRQSVAQAFIGAKPMRVLREASGAVPITEEKEGLIRIPVEINGQRRGVMVDTGASFSTISASAAQRAGLKILNLAATVGSSTEHAVSVRVGIAKRLRIGEMTLGNVLFIVVPDSDWGLPRRFKISALIGLPVLMILGRLEFVNSGRPRLLYGTPSDEPTRRAGTHSNLLLSGLTPLVLVRLPGKKSSLVMKLDTGSNSTTFTRSAIADAPELIRHAERTVNHFAGIGGTVTDRKALRLPKVNLSVAGQEIALRNAIVSSRASATSDGVIGEDLLRRIARWTIDFRAMTFTVSK